MSYRDPVEAARARRDALDATLSRLDEDDPRRPGIERELASVHETIEASRRKVALSVLSNVRIATPCPASWEAMTGDDRVRHCALCEKKVYDLAGLTAWESLQLLAEQGEEACVRLHRRRDGTLITADCEVGRRRRRKRRALAAAGALAVSAASALATTSPSPALSVARGASIADDPALRLDAEAFLYGPPARPEINPDAFGCFAPAGAWLPEGFVAYLEAGSFEVFLLPEASTERDSATTSTLGSSESALGHGEAP